MRLIIPCGGDGDRWGFFQGVPKQLLVVEGQTLLERSVGLARVYTDDIWVVVGAEGKGRVKRPEGAPDVAARAKLLGVKVSDAKEFRKPVSVDKVMSSSHLWSSDQDTAVLFGDVYCTPETMRLICKESLGPITFYGRLVPSRLTGKTSPEIYALKFTPGAQRTLRDHFERIRNGIWSGELKRSIADYVHYVLELVEGRSLEDLMRGTPRYLFSRDDWTEDFDNPFNWTDWEGNRRGFNNNLNCGAA